MVNVIFVENSLRDLDVDPSFGTRIQKAEYCEKYTGTLWRLTIIQDTSLGQKDDAGRCLGDTKCSVLEYRLQKGCAEKFYLKE